MHVDFKWLIGLAPVALAVGVFGERSGESSVTQLSFLSVGQGDCAVFQHEGITVLIDVGPRTDSFDAGERIVTPELRRLGVKTIDLVLISHPDADHLGGLRALARRFSIGKIVAPACFRDNATMLESLNRAGFDPRSVDWITRRRVTGIGSFDIRMDAPDDDRPETDNDGSMFVRISSGTEAAVFSGDASLETESKMLRRSGPWAGSVLKAGHHGSRTSSGDDWLRAVNPNAVILSVGRGNRYGHPHDAAVLRIRESDATIHRTDKSGTLQFGFVRGRFVLKSRYGSR